jgi:hypothetical protein
MSNENHARKRDHAESGWIPAVECPDCGEASHVKSCPKPADIPKSRWQRMSSDARYEVSETP